MRPAFSAAALTNRSTVPIKLRVIDDGGLVDEGSTNISVSLFSDPMLSNGELRIVGTIAADIITMGIAASPAVLTVEVNGEIFQFAVADVTSYFIDGGSGDDSLRISEHVVVRGELRGGPENDTLIGGGGNEGIYGGDGNDYLSGGPGDDVVYGEAGDHTLLSSRGRDVLRPGLGNSSFQLGAFASSLQSLSIEAAIAPKRSRNRNGGASSSILSGRIIVSMDRTFSGSVDLRVNGTGTGSVVGHPCTAEYWVSGPGSVRRLKYRVDLDGNVLVSCSTIGNPGGGSFSGFVAGSISLEKGLLSTKGAVDVSFGGRSHARSSIAGTASITELIADVS